MKRWATVVFFAFAVAACGNPLAPASGAVDDAAIDVFGPYRGVEADNFAASLRGFEEQTGVKVNYTGSADFVADLRQRMESGLDAPDIAVIPQPAVVTELVAAGLASPLAPATRAAIDEHYGPRSALIDDGASGFAAPYRVSPKSLVWYRPDVFAEYGWTVPDSLADLDDLVNRIVNVDDGDVPMAPWCFTMASGSATGWAATDWVEDLVVRQAGVEAYDRWTTGELRWSDPEIRRALETFDELVVATGRSAGGLRSILQTDVSRASEPLFGTPPTCAMYKQASFAEAWFPDDVELGRDLDVFVLPDDDPSVEAPILVGADTLLQFSDAGDVHRLMEYLVSPDGGREWARRGGYLSARASIDVETYHTPWDRVLARLLTDGRELRFDSSDVIPSAVGAGVLWQEITTWVAGTVSLDQFVTTIDDALSTVTAPE